MEAVLTNYRAFRDSVSEDLFFEIAERTPELQALFDALMDLDDDCKA